MDLLSLNFPIEPTIGDFKLNLHMLFEVMAFFVGYRYYLYLKRTQQDVISEANRIWIFIGAALGALIFSRVIGVLENPLEAFHPDTPWLYYYGNKTIVGGLMGGLLGVEIIKKIIGETRSSGDIMAFPIILGLVLGRIGCFSMGIYEETYGTETQFFMGMDLGDGLMRHPVTLYEIAYLLSLWLLLSQLSKRITFREGILFQLVMIAYLFFRFMLDFIKPGYSYFINLTTIQYTCLIGLLYYSKTIFQLITSPSKLLNHER